MDKLKYIVKNKIFVLISAFFVFWLPTIFFLKIAGEIIEKEPIVFDLSILNSIHAYSNSFYDYLFFIMTTIGGVSVMLPVTILVLAYFIYKKQRRNALIIIAGVGGATAANLILKLLFQRERPSLWYPLITENSYSFPSGHAMISAALIICLVSILWKTRWRWLAIISGTVLIILIGLSRLYFGVHYPSDILAGWCASIAWIYIVITIVNKFADSRHDRSTA